MIEIKNVSGIDLCFGGDMKKLLPAWKDIPDEFKDGNSKWNKVVSDWFFRGLKNVKWTPKPGINSSKAVAHINAIMSSFEPKHEHKEAGCAYLLSEFFDDVTYETIK
jgi:hypothetical protein